MQLEEHEYLTLNDECSGEFKDKGSRFIAYAVGVSTEEEANDFIDRIKKQHHKARHHCYAFRVGHDSNLTERQNDDGEPSGTAGRPILGQLISFGLQNSIVVVVRYFGGVKLGTSGLIKAYRQAAKEALETGHIIKKEVLDSYLVDTDYTCSHHFMDACKKLDVPIMKQEFTSRAKFMISLPPQTADEKLLQLKALTLQVPEEMAENEETLAWHVDPIDLS